MRRVAGRSGLLLLILIVGPAVLGVMAQAPLPIPAQAPSAYAPGELDRVVSPIALYPDPLLAQVLAAATFSDQIPDAARWADQHHYLTGDALASAIAADQVPWDPSVQSLLPFPSILDMMSSDMAWTQELGTAFLSQPNEVMDAVQRQRQIAARYGYLRSNGQVVVKTGPYVEIVPVNPDYIVVPYYDPLVVFRAPRPGFVVGGAIRFGFGVTLTAAFVPWGWHATHFTWTNHTVIINDAPWRRTWANRLNYVHPYRVPRYTVRPATPERHELRERSPQERDNARRGVAPREEHREERRPRR